MSASTPKKKTMGKLPEKKIVKISLEELGKELNINSLTVQMGYHKITNHSALMFHDGEIMATYILSRNDSYATKYEITKLAVSETYVTVFLHNKELLGKPTIEGVN